MRVTISKKLNSLILVVLVLGIGGVSYQATKLFTTDLVGQLKTGLEESSTLFAGRLRGEMTASAQRAQMLGAVSLQAFRFPEDRLKFLNRNLSSETQHVALTLYYRKQNRQSKTTSFVPQWRLLNENLPIEIKAKDFDLLDQKDPIDFDYIGKGKIDFHPAVLTNKLSILRMALPLVKNKKGEFTQILVVDLDQQRLTSLFNESNAYTTYLIDRHWKILTSSDSSRIAAGTDVKYLPLVQHIEKNTTGSGQFEYDDPIWNRQIAAFQKVGFADLVVISQVPMAIATAAKDKLKRRGGLLAAAFIFLALTFGLIFSKRMTRPITFLAEAADKVRQGDFSIHITQKKKKGDEIHELTRTFNEMVTGLAEREKLKGAFQKFHNKEITDMLLSGDIKLGGERLSATVLFTDIRGFTAMSETQEPEVLLNILNRYMTEMVSIIFKHGGIVDKYAGDSILALWGVPKPTKDSAYHAMMACLEMRCRLLKLNTQLTSEALPTLTIGMGLNHGPLIAGNIGSEQRMEYTVIGDTVNTTSRIESVTKELGTDLLVSESVIAQVGPRFLTEMTQTVTVKGKSQPLRLYRVKGFKGEDGKDRIISTPYSEYDPVKFADPNKKAA